MAGSSLWVKLSGKHVDPRAAQQFREQDFPQPEPCTVMPEPPIFSPDAKLSVAESFKGATVLITGAVGFVGSVVLEQLLRLCPEITRVYLVVRYADPLAGMLILSVVGMRLCASDWALTFTVLAGLNATRQRKSVWQVFLDDLCFENSMWMVNFLQKYRRKLSRWLEICWKLNLVSQQQT